MTLKIFNTQSGRKEDFVPLDPPNVRMYVCGITPYDETHLGHGRAYVTFDVVRRWLEHSGYKVTHIQNITDVDDKLIVKSHESRVGMSRVAEQYTQSFYEVMDQLNVLRATKYPKATEHIPEMVSWIVRLMEKGFAYELDGDVYFEVSKYKDYGKLSHRKLEDLQSGARVAVDERKRSPLDFALWKKAKEGEPAWDSPWGKGRPGWHIECSAMSTKYLGESFDIHGGGLDLVFPHHENEVAQTEAATGKPWVKYWLHNGFVNVNKQKMSKSLGNFFTLKEIFAKFEPMAVRLFLLQTHYRSPINFSDEQLAGAVESLKGIRRAVRDYQFAGKSGKQVRTDCESIRKEFVEAMDDDFNTAAALAVIFRVIKLMNQQVAASEHDPKMLELLSELCGVLGIEIEHRTQSTEHRTQIEGLLVEREEARKQKDFAKADQIKNKLVSMGVILEDTPQGTRWQIKD